MVENKEEIEQLFNKIESVVDVRDQASLEE